MNAASHGFLQPFLAGPLPWLYTESTVWTALGIAGVICFGSRFFIQWLYSEKARKVVVPEIFWYLSFAGSMFNLVYALHIDKLPIILGTLLLPFLYGRNLVLLFRSRRPQPDG